MSDAILFLQVLLLASIYPADGLIRCTDDHYGRNLSFGRHKTFHLDWQLTFKQTP